MVRAYVIKARLNDLSLLPHICEICPTSRLSDREPLNCAVKPFGTVSVLQIKENNALFPQNVFMGLVWSSV
jgi:hypothetical protein